MGSLPEVLSEGTAVPAGKGLGADGAPVGRATLSNWLIKNAREFFTPMFDYFHRQLLKRSFVMADETPFQVLNEKDKKP